MGLLRNTLIVTCLLCLVSAWYHEVGIEQHLQFYHEHVTRRAGQGRYTSFLVSSCLPQQDRYILKKPSLTTTRDLLNTLYHCCYTRGKDCLLPDVDTTVSATCQEFVTLRAPCGHIMLHTKHNYSMYDTLGEKLDLSASTLVCVWDFIGRGVFAINLTVLTLDMPLTSYTIKRPLVAVKPDDRTGVAEFLYGKVPPTTFVATSLQLRFFGSSMIDTHIKAVYHIIPLPMWQEHKHIYQDSLLTLYLEPAFHSTIPNQLMLFHLQMFIQDIVKLQVWSNIIKETAYAISVFDGPGPLSKDLQPNCSESTCNFRSTTFHMFVILGRYQAPGEISMSYHADLQTESPFECNRFEISRKDFDDFTVTSHSIQISENDVERAFSHFGCISCGYFVSYNRRALWYTQPASVRIEIENFKYDGYTSGNYVACMFGGLYIMLGSSAKLLKERTYDGANNFCHSLAENHTASISADFEVVLALSVFQGYSRASLKATVHYTYCQATFLPWPDFLTWVRLQLADTATYRWISSDGTRERKAVHCLQLNIYPSNRQLLFPLTSSKMVKHDFKFGSLTSLTVLTHPNPFYTTFERQMLQYFTDIGSMSDTCTSSFLARVTYFNAEFDDVISEVMILNDDRQTVMTIEAYAFTIELSDCSWRHSSITIIGEKHIGGKEYHIWPPIPVILGGIFAQQMATAEVKAVFVSTSATWTVQYQYIYTPLAYQTRDSYFIDVITLFYRGYCLDISTNDSVTIIIVDKTGDFRKQERGNAIKWIWHEMPRSPHLIVWRIYYPVQLESIPYNVTLERQVSDQSYLAPDCDIIMTVLRETKATRVNKCQSQPEFLDVGNGKCYHVQKEVSQTWHEANSYCQAKGASLASLDSAHELHTLQRVFESLHTGLGVLIYGHILYIGITKNVSSLLIHNPRLFEKNPYRIQSQVSASATIYICHREICGRLLLDIQ